MFSVDNKVALITGAARGIGLECTRTLLRNGLKAAALIDINDTNGQKALTEIEAEFGSNRAIFIKADVSDKSLFEDAFKVTVKTFNQLDIVINNAGIIQEVEWEKCIDVNLIGTIFGSTLAMEKYLPKYKNANEGVILNIASRAGITQYEPLPVYAATKHGIVGYSRSIGGPMHYKISNVRVVTICPKRVDTAILVPTEEQLQEPFLSEFRKQIDLLSPQSLEDLAAHAVKIIESGSSGSVWYVADNQRTEVTFKDY